MRTPVYTTRFEKDLKLMIKRGCDPENIKSIVTELIEEIPLERKHRKIAKREQHNPAGSGRRRGYPRRPPTPPCVRFRTRRFMKRIEIGGTGP